MHGIAIIESKMILLRIFVGFLTIFYTTQKISATDPVQKPNIIFILADDAVRSKISVKNVDFSNYNWRYN